MSAIFEDITATIGYTPLVRINQLAPADTTILAKLESFNPGQSIKDRIAVAMIEKAEQQGLISAKTIIVEPTSGNTGIGLACVCAAKQRCLIVTMPESMSIERKKMLEFFGATVVLTPADKGMGGAVEKANQLVSQYEDSFMPQQFTNPANPKIHRETTAMEIWSDTDHKVDILVAGVGTGGTITGCGEVLKRLNAEVKLIGVEPSESAVLSGGLPGPHKIQGIGAGFVPDVLNREIIDEIITVSSTQAAKTTREVAAREGILAGISSGAALYAAVEVAKRTENKGKTIIVIFPDTGGRYVSTDMFDS